jgi:uncharacterized protein (DUF1015 family)
LTNSDSKIAFLVRPFAALRPAAAYAEAVAAPPYDVLNIAEARALAAENPHSFLHVSRAEIDLPASVDPYANEVYLAAGRNLTDFEARGVLVRDRLPAYYAYRISNNDHSQTGLAVAASISAYNENRIRRHELTRPAKETDRVRQIDAVNAITGPVMLVHRALPALDALLERAIAGTPALLAATVAGWRHEVWAITGQSQVAAISALMNAVDALYIADGHHRSAAAARIAAERAAHNPDDDGSAAYNGFLAVSFAEDAVTLLDYNRVVSELNGHSNAEFLAALKGRFHVETSLAAVRSDLPLHYGLYLDGQWYTLSLLDELDTHDAVAGLDVSVLDHLVLAPLLGILDSRTDPRIDFVGGSRGPQAVADRVDGGSMRAGFTLCPTRMSDLFAIADLGRIMPPKSTWFEPKLADGLLSLPLD